MSSEALGLKFSGQKESLLFSSLLTASYEYASETGCSLQVQDLGEQNVSLRTDHIGHLLN